MKDTLDRYSSPKEL